MKNRILILLFISISVISFAQKTTKDTIYIKFEKDLDFKKTVNNQLLFNIKNLNYHKELKRYEILMEKYKLKPPPLPIYKPLKYKELQVINDCFETKRIVNKKIKYYDKHYLKKLEPHRMVIYIVEKTNCFYRFYPVTFYIDSLE